MSKRDAGVAKLVELKRQKADRTAALRRWQERMDADMVDRELRRIDASISELQNARRQVLDEQAKAPSMVERIAGQIAEIGRDISIEQHREQLEKVLTMQREITDEQRLQHQRDLEIAAIREKYKSQIDELRRLTVRIARERGKVAACESASSGDGSVEELPQPVET